MEYKVSTDYLMFCINQISIFQGIAKVLCQICNAAASTLQT